MINAINIDFEPFAETKWYSGTYSVTNKNSVDEYDFTLITNIDFNSGTEPFDIEITWIDREPPDVKKVNEAIIHYFNKGEK